MRLLQRLTIALVFLGACEGRPRQSEGAADEVAGSKSEPHLAELDLRAGVSEEAEAPLFGPADKSHAELVLRLQELKKEDNAKALFVRLGTASVGLARAEELGRLLGALRSDKKLPVVCHADGYDNATMLLAARGCDEVWLSPAGHVETVGLAAQLVFMRSMLEELHVQVDFLQVGKYKGASEPFTRDEPSPEARASLEQALTGMRAAWIEGIEAGRSKSAAKLQLEDGPHTADDAKKLGLVDAIGFEKEARNRAVERAGVQQRVAYFGGREPEDDGIASLVRALSGTSGADVPHIAVVVATGAISMSDGSPFASGGIAERELTKIIERLKNDESTQAVVLRIDSPGGSALASDLLWRALMDLREKKPLIASVGGMSASGGYYLASAATKVVAERTSIVGSIGVVAGKLSFSESLAEIGVHVEAVPAKKDHTRALYGSPLARWDDATRDKVLHAIEDTYRLFVTRIAEGRGLDPDTIAPAAEGRIMGGADAQKAKLVDELGGLDRAVALAIELAKADAAIPIHIVRRPSGLLGLLGVDGSTARSMDAIERGAVLEREASRRAARSIAGLLPYRRELAQLAANVGPLSEGEYILATLPFALGVR